MLSNSLGTAVGEVTGITATTITFANLDPLNINQSGAATNNIKAISGGANTVAYRLFAVTYYLTVPGAGQTPRLMRQVNGLSPVPGGRRHYQFAVRLRHLQLDHVSARRQSGQPPRRGRIAQQLIQKVNIRGDGAKHVQQREQVAEHVFGDFGQRAQYGISQSLSVTL